MEKVLVIDDSELICKIITSVLKKEAFEVSFILTGERAIETVHSVMPDLILLDIVLPTMDGHEICRLLKSDPITAEIPVIFVTATSDESSIVSCFDAGGVDYICKPFNAVELIARVRAHIKNKLMTDLLKTANENLERSNKQLEEMLLEKQQWALTDSMTGLYNRHFVMDQLPRWDKMAVSGLPFYILMADVDNFKLINDQYGHCMGDYVLCTISDLMLLSCKDKASVIRLGGEEFLIVFPDKTLNEAMELAEYIRQQICEYPFFYEGFSLSCTLTIGVSPADRFLSIERLLIKADNALYEGKRNGKNCVIFKE